MRKIGLQIGQDTGKSLNSLIQQPLKKKDGEPSKRRANKKASGLESHSLVSHKSHGRSQRSNIS